MTDNYYRNTLKSIKQHVGRTPIMISGTFRYEWNPRDYLTFTEIRPYVPDNFTNILCDHITIKISDVQKYLDIGKMVDGNRYYLMVDIVEYTHNSNRMGVTLSHGYEAPIFDACELDQYDNDLFDFAFPLDFWCMDNGFIN